MERHVHIYEHLCVQFKKKTPAETQANLFFMCSKECSKGSNCFRPKQSTNCNILQKKKKKKGHSTTGMEDHSISFTSGFLFYNRIKQHNPGDKRHVTRKKRRRLAKYVFKLKLDSLPFLCIADHF